MTHMDLPHGFLAARKGLPNRLHRMRRGEFRQMSEFPPIDLRRRTRARPSDRRASGRHTLLDPARSLEPLQDSPDHPFREVGHFGDLGLAQAERDGLGRRIVHVEDRRAQQDRRRRRAESGISRSLTAAMAMSTLKSESEPTARAQRAATPRSPGAPRSAREARVKARSRES